MTDTDQVVLISVLKEAHSALGRISHLTNRGKLPLPKEDYQSMGQTYWKLGGMISKLSTASKAQDAA